MWDLTHSPALQRILPLYYYWAYKILCCFILFLSLMWITQFIQLIVFDYISRRFFFNFFLFCCCKILYCHYVLVGYSSFCFRRNTDLQRQREIYEYIAETKLCKWRIPFLEDIFHSANIQSYLLYRFSPSPFPKAKTNLPVVVFGGAAAIGDLHPHLDRGAPLYRHVRGGVGERKPGNRWLWE
jgi:hypothetical protein